MRPFVFPLMLSDIHKVLDDDDQAYFREQREKQLGVKLEEARPGLSYSKHRSMLQLQAQRVLRLPTRIIAQARREVGVTAHKWPFIGWKHAAAAWPQRNPKP